MLWQNWRNLFAGPTRSGADEWVWDTSDADTVGFATIPRLIRKRLSDPKVIG